MPKLTYIGNATNKGLINFGHNRLVEVNNDFLTKIAKREAPKQECINLEKTQDFDVNFRQFEETFDYGFKNHINKLRNYKD